MKKILLYCILLLVGLPTTNAQTVSTYCGIAYSGGGNYHSSTRAIDERYFSRPYGIAIDNTLNIMYVSHEHSIVVIQGNLTFNRSGYSGDPAFGAGHLDQTGIAARYDRPAGMAVAGLHRFQ